MAWKTAGSKQGKMSGKAESEEAPPHPQPPPPLTQQDAPPWEVPIALQVLRLPDEWCGSYGGVGPLVANSHGDRGWG